MNHVTLAVQAKHLYIASNYLCNANTNTGSMFSVNVLGSPLNSVLPGGSTAFTNLLHALAHTSLWHGGCACLHTVTEDSQNTY